MKEFDYSDGNIANTINKDYFLRNKYLMYLIDIINSTVETKTLALDGTWGSGKTVFVHQFLYLLKDNEMYNNLLTKQKKESVVRPHKIEGFYFNAWENDLIKNPTVNLLFSLINEYKLFNCEDGIRYKEILDFLTNLTLKFTTNGLMGLDDIKNHQHNNEFLEIINANEIKKKFNETINLIKEIKNVDKVVVVIDELDRCRPSYAIELLETIKHFYCNNDLIFIISTDLNQISCAVKNLYGQNFDSDLYLQRFFDGIFSLSVTDISRYLQEELNFNIDSNYTVSEVCKTAIQLYDLSIREINKYINQIKILATKLEEREWFYNINNAAKPLFVTWGLAIKYKNNNLYEKFRHGGFTKEEFNEFINLNLKLSKRIIKIWYDNRPIPESIDINDELFQMYKYIFLDNKVELNRDENLKLREKFEGIDINNIKIMLDF